MDPRDKQTLSDLYNTILDIAVVDKKYIPEDVTAYGDGISLVDSTSIAVCKNYRINSHKVFQGFAARGKLQRAGFMVLKCM